MKELLPADRPREKLLRVGVEALGDNELLALVIGHGTRQHDALALASRVLAAAGGAAGLTRWSAADLARRDGLGRARAARILAAVTLGRRTLEEAEDERPQMLSVADVARYLLPRHGAHPVERFGVMLLDARLRLIDVRLLTVGLRDASLVHSREVFREAMLANASAVVAFHNHPTGDATPSQEDCRLTMRLVMAGDVVGIELVDHLILAGSRFTSLVRRRGNDVRGAGAEHDRWID